MSNLTKTVNKISVNGTDTFIYTLNAAYSGLSGPATDGTLTDFFPSKIKYQLPQTGSGITSITETSQPGGTLVTFHFGPVQNGTSISFTVACSFGPGRVNNDTFTNTANLFADGVQVAAGSAPTVTLTLIDNFKLAKLYLGPTIVNPGDTIEYTLQLSTDLLGAGYQLNNVVITDVLPPQLIADTTFTPIGEDIPFLGYSDSSTDGITGNWSGNTLNFTLPSYKGALYQIKFRAKVLASVAPGTIVLNTANWTVSGAAKTPATNSLQIFIPVASIFLRKNAPLYAALGGPIQYTVFSTNTGNVPLTNWVLTDTLPAKVDLTAISFDYDVAMTYSIRIRTSNNPGVDIPVIAGATQPSGTVDLTPFIPAGARVLSVTVTSPSFATNANRNASSNLVLFGTINNQAILGDIITNNATNTANSGVGNVNETVSANTTINGKSVLNITKTLFAQPAQYYPLSDIQFQLRQSNSTGGYVNINPVFADLLPVGVVASQIPPDYLYFDALSGNSYDSRLGPVPIPAPQYEVIANYAGTGRTLLRLSFNNFTLNQGNALSVFFHAIVGLNPPSTITNVGVVGNPGDNTQVIGTPFPDVNDLDGDGITNENLAQSSVTFNVLSTSEFMLDKYVKGNLDSSLTQSGHGTAGSEAEYKLYITNNQDVELKNVEIIDILPYIGDTGVMLTNVPRGSQYNVYATSTVSAEIVNVLGNPVTTPNPVINIFYSTSTDPVRFNQSGNPIGTGTWSTTPPSDITTLKSIKVTTDPSVILGPADRLIVSLNAVIPVGAPMNLTAYNSFAVRADQVSGGIVTPLLPTEPNKVGLTVGTATGASIGNFVWIDLNGNGIYDVGEPGINGVTVQLYDSTGTTLLATTVTANNAANQPGYYSFTGLAAGNYTVKFTAPAGYNLTIQNLTINGSKPNPATGFTNVITLAVNQVVTDIIAGLISPNQGSIGDFVWNDLNGNGIYDVGEPGVNGVTVELYNAAGTTLLATTVTANNSANQPGYYHFTDLAAGTYTVKFIAPDDYELTIQNLTINGSKPNPATGFTNVITLTANQVITDIIAGILLPCAPPIINTTIYCVEQDSVYDPLKGVTAFDCQGNNITDDVIVTQNTVNTAVPGIYSVSYQATDSRGQTTAKTIQVSVCRKGPYYQAISDLIESVALEQAALSHIINAEGEKIQKALAISTNIADIIRINDSVKATLNATAKLEMILQSKLEVFDQCDGLCGCCEN